jgi:hypothetical protein
MLTRAPALRALLWNAIDYAGVFPPASLPLAAAVANYQQYQQSEHSWILGRLVVAFAQVKDVPETLDGHLSVLTNADHSRASVIEARMVVATSKPTYCEVRLDELDEVSRIGSFAKIRTGGVVPESIPSLESVADFLRACVARKLAFKATAGLHHPIRSQQALTYQQDSLRAPMHGFIHLLLAAAFAWHGETQIELILSETDAGAFRFDDKAHWRNRSLRREQVESARVEFVHGFGSCSFAEPVAELQSLGWL